jgi:ketosteroid isomerase-like protein
MKLRTATTTLALALGCMHPAAPTAPAPTASTGEAPQVAAAAPDASVDAAAVAARPTPPPTLADAEVRALVDAWLSAQNAGDFAAYERLYAPRFTGIRRSGPRVRRFDRAGWVADREVMFRAAMQVAARDVTVDASTGVATVRLTQEFSQGAFHDVGRKEIVLVRSGAALRIAREEMLDSTVAEAASEAAAPAAGTFLPTFDVGDVRYAIIAPAQDGWAEGAAELVAPGEVVVARRAVRMGALPEALRGYAAQRFRFYGSDGQTCEAGLGAFSLISRIDVHFGVSQRWAGEDLDGERHAPYTPAEIAAEAFDMGAQVLVARLDDACGRGALWGQLASQPAVTAFRGAPAPAPLAAAVLQRFRALPAWRAAETAYHQDGAAQRARGWDMHDGHAPAVVLWQAPNNGRRFAVVSASTMVGGCADFSASMTAVFEVTGAQTLVLQSDGTNPSLIDTDGAADLDGDGRPEFITPEGLFRRMGAMYRPQVLFAVPNNDCPC